MNMIAPIGHNNPPENTLPQTVDEVIAVMTGSRDELVARAFGAVVTSDSELSVATDMRSTIKTHLKGAEAERQGLVKPLNDHVKYINGKFKTITEPLEDAEATLRKKCDKYQIEAENEKRRIAEEERKVREAELLAAAEVKAAAGNEAGAERLLDMAVSVKAKPEEVGRGGYTGAKATLVSYWEFDVLDIKALAIARPDLVQVNPVAVNAAIRAGLREVPGLNIREEKRSSVRG